MGILDNIERGANELEDKARAQIRAEAAKGAREAVMPYVVVAIGLALLALSKGRRRR